MTAVKACRCVRVCDRVSRGSQTLSHEFNSTIVTYPCPGPQHPGPVLLDLQPLDVDHGQGKARDDKSTMDPDRRLKCQIATKGPAG